MEELKLKLSKMGISIWRGYDLDFNHIWICNYRFEHLYIEYSEDALRGFILSIERDMKLQ